MDGLKQHMMATRLLDLFCLATYLWEEASHLKHCQNKTWVLPSALLYLIGTSFLLSCTLRFPCNSHPLLPSYFPSFLFSSFSAFLHCLSPLHSLGNHDFLHVSSTSPSFTHHLLSVVLFPFLHFFPSIQPFLSPLLRILSHSNLKGGGFPQGNRMWKISLLSKNEILTTWDGKNPNELGKKKKKASSLLRKGWRKAKLVWESFHHCFLSVSASACHWKSC